MCYVFCCLSFFFFIIKIVTFESWYNLSPWCYLRYSLLSHTEDFLWGIGIVIHFTLLCLVLNLEIGQWDSRTFLTTLPREQLQKQICWKYLCIGNSRDSWLKLLWCNMLYLSWIYFCVGHFYCTRFSRSSIHFSFNIILYLSFRVSARLVLIGGSLPMKIFCVERGHY